MAQNIEPLSELTSKAAQNPAATAGLHKEAPQNPLPSAFDSASSTADLYGYTTTNGAGRGNAPTLEHRGAVWNQTAREGAELSGTPTPTPSRPSPVRPPHARTSSSNYVTALASRAEQGGIGEAPRIDTAVANASQDPAENPPLGSPSSATWRPTMFRQQSWSKEDQKRLMQERLMSPVEGKGVGYSSKEGEGEN